MRSPFKLRISITYTLYETVSKLNDLQAYKTNIPKPNPISPPKITWEENFILTYEQYVYDNITNFIDEWVTIGRIAVADFNRKYKPKGLGVKMYLRAIRRFCIHANIQFKPCEAIYFPNTGTIRCRIFEKV